jgi:Ser/Thr protein kinase RdoA (MazF antagonist)
MQPFVEIEPVLAIYPADCRPSRVESLGSAGGFSGAKFWRLDSPRGRLCLRRWPPEHPEKARLSWIHGIIAHVGAAGFLLLPTPLSDQTGQTFCEHDGFLWELTPWLRGTADYWSDPRPKKLAAAMTALAEFHRSAKTFAVERPSSGQASLAVSRGLGERLELVHRLMAGGLVEMQSAVERNREVMPRVAALSQMLFPRIAPELPGLERQLRNAAQINVPLQPCLRDIWHDHVLFDADRVSGIVDTGSLRMETVACDISRLLGSLCSNDREGWSLGLSAYQQVSPLPTATRTLVAAFDRSQVLLAGVKWIEWVFMEKRTFADPIAVEKRMEHILTRLQAPSLGSLDGLFNA